MLLLCNLIYVTFVLNTDTCLTSPCIEKNPDGKWIIKN